MDVLLRILGLQEKKLGHDEVRVHVVDLAVHKDDPILEETRVDIVRALSTTRLFYDNRNEI